MAKPPFAVCFCLTTTITVSSQIPVAAGLEEKRCRWQVPSESSSFWQIRILIIHRQPRQNINNGNMRETAHG